MPSTVEFPFSNNEALPRPKNNNADGVAQNLNSKPSWSNKLMSRSLIELGRLT